VGGLTITNSASTKSESSAFVAGPVVAAASAAATDGFEAVGLAASAGESESIPDKRRRRVQIAD
jgi:hypothetical protein